MGALATCLRRPRAEELRNSVQEREILFLRSTLVRLRLTVITKQLAN